MKKNQLFRSALVMAGGSLAMRLLNIVYRMSLAGYLGAAGLGLYQLLLSVFLLAVTVSTSGISLTVTRLTAESLSVGNAGRARCAVRRCIAWAVLFSLLAAAALCLGSGWIASALFADPRTARPLRLLAPGLPFMAVSSCLKGYFVARRSAFSSVSGDLLEQLVTMGLAAGIFAVLRPQDLEAACCAVTLSSTVGEGVSCLFHFLLYLQSAKKIFAGQRPDRRGIFRTILHIALPSMGGYTARNVLSAAENILIPRGLRAHGAGAEASLAQYGRVQGMAMPVLLFPSAFLSALASLLIPEVAEAHASGRRAAILRVTCRSLQMTLLFSFLMAAVFWGFSQELGLAFYRDAQAGELLRILSPLVPLLYLDGIVDSILKGLDQQVSSLKYNVADSSLRVAGIALLVPRYGVQGYLAVLFFSTVLNASLSLHRLLRVSAVRVDVPAWVLKPALCAAAAVALAQLLQLLPFAPLLPALPFAAARALLACAAYPLLLRACGGLSREDLAWLRGSFH